MKKTASLAKKALILLLTFIFVAGPLFIAEQAHAAGTRFILISSQLTSTLALDSNQEIWAWGSNASGQFGNGTTNGASTPTKVEVLDGGTPVKFQQVNLGWNHSLALDINGQLWSAGSDTSGELGNGTSGDSLTWNKLTITDGATLVTFTTIAALRATSYAVDSNGALWSWGFRSETADPQVPMKNSISNNGAPVMFKELKADSNSMLAIDSFDHLWDIYAGGERNAKLNPMDGGAEAEFQSLAVGYGYGDGSYYQNLALDKNGDIWTWGGDDKGQLGDGPTHTPERWTPEKLTVMDSGNRVRFAQISAGQKQALALDEYGTMWAWGNNDAGQLGNNSTIDLSVPTKVTLLDDNGDPLQFTFVEAGYGQSFGLDSNGQIWAWGYELQAVPTKLKFESSVLLSTSKTSLAYGESVTLTASVTGELATPTGNVNFMDGSTSLGSVPLTNGSAQLVVPALNAGSHQLTASFGGNGEYTGQTSNQIAVTVAANPAKAITAFSFASPAATGTINETNKTIAVTVPFGTNVTALEPTIVHSGASISPASGAARNFTNPVTYTVTAADSTTQSYTVTVTVAANPAKAITAFSFASPAATGTINEMNKTIAVTVPYGTNVTALVPTIVHSGASISPNNGIAQDFSSPVTYTVTAADSTTQSYIVTVTVAANPAKAITAFSFANPAATGTINETNKTIAVTVPFDTNVTALVPTIVHSGASISPNNGIAQDFSNPVTYTVTAADSSTQNYTVTVTVAANPAKAITAFSFTSPAATGTVNETNKTIAITVPFGTNVTAFVPTIVHSGANISPNNGIAQDFSSPVTYTVTAADSTTQSYIVTVTVAANPAKAITAFSFTNPAATGTVNETNKTIAVTVPFGTNVTALVPTIVHSGASISPNNGIAQDFSNPVTYTVTAADSTTQSYTVTLTVAANPAKAITAFSFASPAAAGTINETNKTIAVTVPYGTNVTALAPTITHSGASISPASGAARNFTNPVTYTVTAADSTTQSYTVTVTVAANPAKAITAFSFASPAATGTINETNKTIAVTVPYGTNVTALVPTIVHSGASISPNNGIAQDFSNPVTYTVTAADSTTQSYTVTVTVQPPVLVPSPPSENDNEPAKKVADLLLNSKVIALGASTITDGNKRLSIGVNRSTLDPLLAAEGKGAVLTFHARETFATVVASLDGELLRNLQQNQTRIELKTGQAIYTLSSEHLSIDSLISQLGESAALKDIKIEIGIQIQAGLARANTIQDGGTTTPLTAQTAFTLQAKYGETILDISKLHAQAEHSLVIPEHDDKTTVLTMLVIEADGSTRPLPTKVAVVEGKRYAKVSSLSANTYVAVSHSNFFSDITKHWAAQGIIEMSARMVVKGTGEGLYRPDQFITRAEFAAIIVRGLGLTTTAGGISFIDVEEHDWYSDVVQTATSYKLITGFEDGTFRPNDIITREQAMSIIARSMKLTGLDAKLPSISINEILVAYTDAETASDWALSGIARNIQAGIVFGKSHNTLAPLENVTRAEVAVIVRRLLQQSEFI